MGIIWTIIIGFIAGVIAKFIMPGPNEPSGFILTTILGIVGAFVATYLGQALGWYRPGEGAGLLGAVVGAIILLLIRAPGDALTYFCPVWQLLPPERPPLAFGRRPAGRATCSGPRPSAELARGHQAGRIGGG